MPAARDQVLPRRALRQGLFLQPEEDPGGIGKDIAENPPQRVALGVPEPLPRRRIQVEQIALRGGHETGGGIGLGEGSGGAGGLSALPPAVEHHQLAENDQGAERRGGGQGAGRQVTARNDESGQRQRRRESGQQVAIVAEDFRDSGERFLQTGGVRHRNSSVSIRCAPISAKTA